MRTHLFRLSFLSFACFAVLTFFGPKVDPFLAHFGQAAELRSLLSSVFLVTGAVGVALAFVRTIVGLIMTLVMAGLIFYVAYTYLGG